jgi:hypothetical protein
VLVTYDEHLLQSAIDQFAGAAGAWPDVDLEPRIMLRRFMPQSIQRQTIEELARTVVKEVASIPASRLDELRNYLKEEKPRERLGAIEHALNGLRVVLETNFSFADVCLESAGYSSLSHRSVGDQHALTH